jgi:hypothetical protein
LASADLSGIAKVWDVLTASEIQNLDANGLALKTVAWNPDAGSQ